MAIFGGAFTPRRTEIVDPGAFVLVESFHSGFLRQAPSPTSAVQGVEARRFKGFPSKVGTTFSAQTAGDAQTLGEL